MLIGDEGLVAVQDTPDIQRLKTLVEVLAPARRLRILDVGANALIEGDVSYKQLVDLGYADVIGFEPMEDAFSELQKKQSDREKYFPYALGDGSDQTLHFTKSPGFSSIFSPNWESARLLGFSQGMSETSNIPFRTKRLDDLQEVPPVDFLKIDVQGSENLIIANGEAKLAEAVALQTEVRFFRIYEGEPSFGELEAELSRQGFRFLRLATLKHIPLSRRRYRQRLKRSTFAQAVDGDAFFVRDLTKIGEWSDEKVKRLAVLADGVMDSPDLAVFALDALAARGCVGADVIDAYIDSLPSQRLRR